MIKVDIIICDAQLAYFQNQIISQFNKLSVDQPQAHINTIQKVKTSCEIIPLVVTSYFYVERIQNW